MHIYYLKLDIIAYYNKYFTFVIITPDDRFVIVALQL